jgi:hypothetical protein
MKKLILSLGVAAMLLSLVAQEAHAYCIYNGNSGVALKVLVFKNKADADKLGLINKIQANIGSGLKFLGSKAKEQAAKENANPSWMLANNVTAVLNNANTVNLIKSIKKGAFLKAEHIIQPNDKACWNQNAIRKDKAAENNTMYALIFSADGTKFFGGGKFDISKGVYLTVMNPGTEGEYLTAGNITQ